MDISTIIVAVALIITAATVSIILFEAMRVLWKITPGWMRVAIGSLLAIGIIVLVTS